VVVALLTGHHLSGEPDGPAVRPEYGNTRSGRRRPPIGHYSPDGFGSQATTSDRSAWPGDVGADLAPVRWRLGHDDWHEAPAWPPPRSRELRLYLAGSRATADAEGGSLTERPDGSRAAATWTHDPDNLVPSTVANPFAFLHEFPDERGVQSRPGVLTFTSDAWDRPLDLAGPISVQIQAGSTGPSMHLHAKLSDVAHYACPHAHARAGVISRTRTLTALSSFRSGTPATGSGQATGCACTSPPAISRSTTGTLAPPRIRGTQSGPPATPRLL
jgi:predicted acyl esterase